MSETGQITRGAANVEAAPASMAAGSALRLQRRREHVQAIADRFDADPVSVEAALGDGLDNVRYALVEQATTIAATTWLSVYATRRAAADYHLGQDDAQDWRIVRLVDLDTGAEVDGALQVAWKPALWPCPGGPVG